MTPTLATDFINVSKTWKTKATSKIAILVDYCAVGLIPTYCLLTYFWSRRRARQKRFITVIKVFNYSYCFLLIMNVDGALNLLSVLGFPGPSLYVQRTHNSLSRNRAEERGLSCMLA